MDDLIQEFIEETRESLATIDNQLIDLEKGTGDATLINDIFRLMHTAKGTSGFLSLHKLEKVAHAGENIMDVIRSEQRQPTTREVDLIFRSIDAVRDILDFLAEEGTEPDVDNSALIAELNACADGTDGAAEASEPTTAEEQTPEEAPQSAPADDGAIGMDVYDKLDAEIAALEAAEAAAEAAEAGSQQDATPAPPAPAAPAPAETKSTPAKSASKSGGANAAQSLRVSVNVLEDLMTLVSELVLTRNQLLQVSRHEADSALSSPIQQLNYVVSDLQEAVMKTRMQPVGNAWAKLPRIVRDISHELGKDIDLVMEGEETELDRQVLDLIKDPLTHMVRNSCDHGIETPQERTQAGKPSTGTINLRAYHEGGQIVIEIADDGKGLNKTRIKDRIVERGLATFDELDNYSDRNIYMFIFKPGFSTAEQVTAVSGRGVGMDVVRSNIEKIGGSIELDSTEGQGSIFRIKIPLTLAIVSALIIESAEQRFAIPQVSIQELVRVSKNGNNRIEVVNEVPVLRLRDRLLPIFDLKRILGEAPSVKELYTDENGVTDDEKVMEHYDGAFVIVISVGASVYGLMVDAVYDTEEIVIKPTSPLVQHIAAFSGNTILGDGSVIMILDPQGLINMSRKGNVGGGSPAIEPPKQEITEGVTRSGEKIALLIMKDQNSREIAVPLSLVSRLERFSKESLEMTQSGMVVQYRNKLMPLMDANGDTRFDRYTLAEDEITAVVFSDDRSNNNLGILVSEICDIVNDHMNIETESEKDGFLGSAIIAGKAVDVIDTTYFMNQTGKMWYGRSDTQLPFMQAAGTMEKVGAYGTEAIRKVRPRALIVDDSAFFRGLMAPALESAGFDVTAASGVKEAMKCLENEDPYEVIVSDIEMPEINGFEFAQMLKNNDRFKHIPLIAVSSHDTPQDKEYGLSQGFDFYLEKFESNSLRDTLIEAMKLRADKQEDA